MAPGRGFFVHIKSSDSHFCEVMEKMQEALSIVYSCYNELREMGILTIEEAPSKDDSAQED